jgi:cellulose synthase/poly-beta-1,6-N-acetylglucosamine synthase-like glycosyltransferase
MSTTAPLFWLSAGFLAYTYVGYPALLKIWGWLLARPARVAWGEPRLSLIVIAYNEAARIGQRIENFLDLDYNWGRIEIIVASDGSSDGTVDAAWPYRSPQLKVVEFRSRRGKSAVLNDLIPMASGEIVVLADARQRFEAEALRALVANFADPEVGAVSGELMLLAGGEGSEVGKGVDFYWRYEKLLRQMESSVDSSVGVTGAIYALRKSLFRPIPVYTILDDVLIPMNVVRQGYRVVFEPDARAYDWTRGDARSEFKRKLRTIAGNYQLFFQQPWLLNPFANRLWFQTVSHKACRLLGPLFLFTALAANLALAAQPLYRAALVSQVVFYAAAFLGYLTRGRPRRPFLLNVPYAFCLLNWATVLALVRLIGGRQQVTWERTAG